MRASAKNRLRVAFDESRGRYVNTLPCGAIGTARKLFWLARHLGFDGTENAFWQRLKTAGGRKSLAELSVPTDKVRVSAKKRTQSDDVKDAIKALDARKAAMR